MKAAGSPASRAIRVLSPRIEPPDRADDGSTASTATFEPAAVRSTPSWSMKVDLPTPGTPLIPIRRAPPACGNSATSSSWAASRWSPRRDSTSVMARAIARRSPASTPSASPATSGTAITGGPWWPPRPLSCVAEALGQGAQQVLRGVGDDGSGWEDRGGAHLLQGRDVVGRDDPTDHDQDVVSAERGEGVPQRRHQGEVTGGEGGDADDVHVG